MSSREQYAPGHATGAEVRNDGGRWSLVVVRDLAHPPAVVWEALTDPAQLREWAPFDADRSLGSAGTVTLTTVGSPQPHVTKTTVTRAEAPTLLEFDWGGQGLRWELKPLARGTRLTLWHNIDRNYIAMGAAGWHICFDVMERMLDGHPIGRLVGPDAAKFSGWQRLFREYTQLFDGAFPKETA
jgi:uncharacterized protein YndB with AHSA1/START domain